MANRRDLRWAPSPTARRQAVTSDRLTIATNESREKPERRRTAVLAPSHADATKSFLPSWSAWRPRFVVGAWSVSEKTLASLKSEAMPRSSASRGDRGVAHTAMVVPPVAKAERPRLSAYTGETDSSASTNSRASASRPISLASTSTSRSRTGSNASDNGRGRRALRSRLPVARSTPNGVETRRLVLSGWLPGANRRRSEFSWIHYELRFRSS